MPKMPLNLGSAQQGKLLSWEKLFRRTGGNQHELPTWLLFDPLSKATGSFGLSSRRKRLQLDDQPLVSPSCDQIGPLTAEEWRKIGTRGLDEHIVSLGSILLGDPLDSLPFANQRVP